MYRSSDIADKLRQVSKSKGMTMKTVLEDCGLNFNMMTMMRTSMPKADTLAKLADRLECSVDYLLGRTTEMLTPGAGHTAAPIPEEVADLEGGPQLSRNASEMLELFEQLPGREQVLFIGRLQEAVARTAGEGDAKGSGSSPVKAG